MSIKTEREYQKNRLLKDGDYKSTKEIFERIAKYCPDSKIFGELDKENNIIYHTSKEVLRDIEAIGDGLIDFGLEEKHIAISADNSYRYVLCDLSIAGGVGVVTPIDRDASEDLCVTLLSRCDADAIICSASIIEKIKKVQERCPKLKTIITIDKEVNCPSFSTSEFDIYVLFNKFSSLIKFSIISFVDFIFITATVVPFERAFCISCFLIILKLLLSFATGITK